MSNKAATSFRYHPLGDVIYRKKYHSIQLYNKPMHGLTKLLPQLFYPKYTYNKAIKNNNKSKPEVNEEKKYKKIKGSARVGRGFDTAVTDCVRLLSKYPFLRVRNFLNAASSIENYAKQMTVADVRKMRRLINRRNPYLKMFLSLMDKKKCTPVATQVPVANYNIEAGTLVDVVVWDETIKAYRDTECKTGFDNYLTLSSGNNLKTPFNDQPDHPLNQHILQMSTTHELYKSTFPKLKIGEPMLLYFQSGGVNEFTRPDWIKNRIRSMLNVIKNKNQ